MQRGCCNFNTKKKIGNGCRGGEAVPERREREDYYSGETH
jgi:hypothetical protein